MKEKKLKKEKKVIYYNSEADDDFFGAVVDEKPIDENYKYISRNFFYKILTFLFYRIIMFPIAFIYSKFVRKIKIENKAAVKKLKQGGCFIFANHTHNLADAFLPNVICAPRKPYMIVDSKNLNIPVLKGSTKMLGALPIPTKLSAFKNFFAALSVRLNQKSPIMVYPEAHIWPYYTKIREFNSASMRFPIKFNVPSFCFTTTYQKTKKENKFKTVTYVDGPFFVEGEMSDKEKQDELRTLVFEKMTERSKNSNYEVIRYVKKEKEND